MASLLYEEGGFFFTRHNPDRAKEGCWLNRKTVEQENRKM